MKANRDWTQLLNAIAGDSGFNQVPLSDTVLPVYLADDLRLSLGTRTRVSLWSTQTPSTGVGQFSSIVVVSKFPAYVTRFVCAAANCFWGIATPGITLTAVDAVPAAVNLALPDGAQLPSGGINPNFLVTPTFLSPTLFSQFDVGRNASQLGGVFAPQNLEQILQNQPLYLPAGRSFVASCNLSNTLIQFFMQMEFCTPCLVATDSAGTPIIPR